MREDWALKRVINGENNEVSNGGTKQGRDGESEDRRAKGSKRGNRGVFEGLRKGEN